MAILILKRIFLRLIIRSHWNFRRKILLILSNIIANFEEFLITMGIIKVAIADDHKIFRKGVILSLRPYTNIKFVLEAENGEELIQGVESSKPDIILMDLKM